MISQDNYIYSNASIGRVLEINPRLIDRFEIWDKVILVVFKKGKGLRPRFVSRKAVKKEFTDFRNKGSKLVTITPHAVAELWFLGQSKGSKDQHHLEIFFTHDNLVKSRCDCEDYKNLKDHQFYLNRELGKIDLKCKHQLALESFLGGNLTDYIQELKAIDEEDKYLRAKADLMGDYAYSY